MARCLLFHDWLVWSPSPYRWAFRRCRRCGKWQTEIVDSLGSQWVTGRGPLPAIAARQASTPTEGDGS